MSDSNKYVDMSSKEALRLAKSGFLLLPDIQREYVWDMVDIEKLFESIVDDYPIGACIFWKTNRKTINIEKPNLYHFLTDFTKGESKNTKAPEVLGDEGDYFIVLDGQQRVTSLNIALYGSYTSFKGGRGRSRSNPNDLIKREIYYNLDFHKENENQEKDDEHPPKRFRFLSSEEAKVGRFYKIKELLSHDNYNDLLRWLTEEGFDKKSQDDLTCLFRRIYSSGSDGLIHYYCIAQNTYDEALDIFVRVNSTGKKLSKSDLLFSTLIDGWPKGRENIDKILRTINSKGDKYNFTKDYLMRLMLVLVDAPTNLKIESFDQKAIGKIRNDWNNLTKSLIVMVDFLDSIGISGGFLTSYNATMPLVYYIYKGGSINTEESKMEARKFLSISMAKRLFGVASNNSLSATRTVLQNYNCKGNPFKLSLFAGVNLAGNRTFSVNEDDINFWLDNYVIGQDTYTILTLLYPHLKLSIKAFHQDHCHPHALFENKHLAKLNLDINIIKDWQFKRNLLPNLQFLTGPDNQGKNKKPLKIWVEKEGNSVEYLPENVSLELIHFDEFFEKRKKEMNNQLKKVFGVSSLDEE